MKSIKLIALIATFGLLIPSCVERSGKFKEVLAQRDSLVNENQKLDSNFNQTLTLLNDIEVGFKTIGENEKQIQLNLKGLEGKSLNQREMISAQMSAIKKSMDQNRAKIAELVKLESSKKQENRLLSSANSKLSETISMLQGKIEDQQGQIQTMQAELAKRNIVIEELYTTLSAQQKSLSQQEKMIADQTAVKNTVWYCLATTKQLKKNKIVTDAGLFKSDKVLKADFDIKAFIQVDLRDIGSIVTNSTKVKILSTHPQNSYHLVREIDKKITVIITDQIRFWSVSKYLVVKI
jgi:hypothetical protein